MNYKILGSDQKEYGPVSLEQVRQWMGEGRLNAQTMVQPEGATDWKPLSAFPELMPLTAAAPATAPIEVAPAMGPAPSVKTPALLLIICGALGGLGSVYSAVSSVFGMAPPWAHNMPPDVPPQVVQFVNMMQSMGLPLAVLGLVLDLVILFGGISMLKYQRWGLALAGSILAMLCGNPCCCPIGLVAGIWALVVLVKPEVKSSFR